MNLNSQKKRKKYFRHKIIDFHEIQSVEFGIRYSLDCFSLDSGYKKFNL
jgi:hypothetical protein